MRERLGLCISGGGTTMQEIIKACQSGEIPLNIGCIIASTRKAGGIEKAKILGIPPEDIVVVSPASYRDAAGILDEERFGERIVEEMKRRGIDIVLQNGWLPKTPKPVIEAFDQRIFNQHPGPVPEFGGKGMYGTNVHAAILAFRALGGELSHSEVIAQRVHEEFDLGVVVGKAAVEIHDDDTPESLQKRALPLEHAVQLQLLRDIASGNVRELIRTPLIRPDQEILLATAKRMVLEQAA